MDVCFINDVQAYIINPRHNFIYNKLEIIKIQNVNCAPVGVYPMTTDYPIVVKPIVNLYGMSRDTKVIRNEDKYEEYLAKKPSGEFWMPLLIGHHFTIDIYFVKGKIVFTDAFRSKKSEIFGLFQYHNHDKNFKPDNKIINYLECLLKGYTGPCNIELLNNIILEMHLRFNGDNYIWLNHEDELKELVDGKSIDLFQDDICYIPCFFNGLAAKKQQLILKQYEDNYNIALDSVDGLHQTIATRIGMFLVKFSEREKIYKIKKINRWI